MAFMLGKHLLFIDSFGFMSLSLSNLVNDLPNNAFKYTSQVFKDEKFKLMKQKGVYPHDFMDNFERSNDEQLPKKEDFYSILSNEQKTDDQYNHAKRIWKKLPSKNMGEYHDLYLKSDILLLTDVFENFRKTCLKFYKLDACHYFTWDTMLKMTKIKLDLISDVDMYQFVEKGMRGGISYISKRY